MTAPPGDPRRRRDLPDVELIGDPFDIASLAPTGPPAPSPAATNRVISIESARIARALDRHAHLAELRARERRHGRVARRRVVLCAAIAYFAGRWGTRWTRT